MQYLLDNKEWLLSGVIPTLFVFIAGIIIYKVRKKRNSKNQTVQEKASGKTKIKTDNSKRTINQHGEKSIYIEENKGDTTIN